MKGGLTNQSPSENHSNHSSDLSLTLHHYQFLQTTAAKLMLQKARAAVLLRFRGQRLPTLIELQQLMTPV